MARRTLALLLLLAACRRGLPDKDDDAVHTDPPHTDPPHTDADTAAPPPCAHPETEPNNAEAEAEALPTEVQGCGDFGHDNDVDAWRFQVPEEGWLAVDVEGFSLGSRASLSVALSSPDVPLPVLANRRDGGVPEVRLRFPSPATTWTALVRQAVGPGVPRGSGDDFFYEVMASVTKAPVTWDALERANDTPDAPHLIEADRAAGGWAILGAREAPGDVDWYEVQVPGADHDVTFDVDAHAHGSACNFALRRIDAGGVEVEVVTSDQDGVGWDPWMSHRTAGPERVRVQVVEQEDRAGPACWYRLVVTLEAP